MRLYHLIENDYLANLKSEIINLLVAVSEEGLNEIKTKNLLKDLKKEGYSIDLYGLLSLLDDIDIVKNASKEKIEISSDDADVLDQELGDDEEDINRYRVDQLAKRSASQDIKRG